MEKIRLDLASSFVCCIALSSDSMPWFLFGWAEYTWKLSFGDAMNARSHKTRYFLYFPLINGFSSAFGVPNFTRINVPGDEEWLETHTAAESSTQNTSYCMPVP